MSKPSASVLSKQGDKYIGTPYAKMDCQALVEQMLRDVGINLNLPGSNAWYRKMTWTGSPEECKRTFGRIPVGAFLFILKQDGGEPGKYKADGIGNACHIGVYIARQDGAINSSSKRGKVCYSRFEGKSISGGWNRVGLWDRLSYGEDIDEKIGGSVPVRSIVTSDNGPSVNMFLQITVPSSRIALRISGFFSKYLTPSIMATSIAPIRSFRFTGLLYFRSSFCASSVAFCRRSRAISCRFALRSAASSGSSSPQIALIRSSISTVSSS